MKPKPNANMPTAFDRAVRACRNLSGEEKIALMKLISAWLDGPKLYTAKEVEQYMHAAVNEYVEGQKSLIVTPEMVRRGQ